MSFQKILVALDEQERSKIVFCKALSIAQSDRAELVILSCALNLPSAPSLEAAAEPRFYPDLLPAASQETHTTVNAEIARIKALLKPFGEAAQKQGVVAEAIVKVGAPETLICAVAQACGADLIVMGRRGLKGLPEAILGSVSNYVVHHAACSVLVVQGEH